MQVGTNEMLLDDARRLALRASDAEVDEALDRAALFLRQRVRG